MFFDLEKVCIAFLLKVFSQRLHSVLQLAAPLPINMCNKQHGNNNVRIYTNCTRTMMSMNDSTEEREREFTGAILSLLTFCAVTIQGQLLWHLFPMTPG